MKKAALAALTLTAALAAGTAATETGGTLDSIARLAKAGNEERLVAAMYLAGLRDGANWVVYAAGTGHNTACISKMTASQMVDRVVAAAHDEPDTSVGIWLLAEIATRCPAARD